MLNFTKRPSSVEWPTVCLALVIYGGWLATTWFWAALPLWLLAALGGWFVAWQSSLQHETIHGHPTRWRAVNRLVGLPPLTLLIPYESYRRMHLVHHRDERLTDPIDDPESYYWTPAAYAALPRAARWLVTCQTTLLGRLLLGPPWVMARYLRGECSSVLAGKPGQRRLWAAHGLHAGLVLAWTWGVCGIAPWLYLAAFVYPGFALVLMRSFAEHRAGEGVRERIAVVEHAPLLGLLYLHNNLHAVHHETPQLPWYAIPAGYRANRARLLAQNGGLVYRGYLDVARKFLLTPHDHPVHPHGRVAQAA